MSVTYDIVLSSPFPNYHFFAHRMRELCGQLNLTFFMADQVWVGDFLRKLGQREIGGADAPGLERQPNGTGGSPPPTG